MSGSSQNELTDAIAKVRSNDPLVQNEGVADLIKIGQPATAALLPLMSEGSADVRAQAMYALSEIADSGSRRAFRLGLEDDDERVRAYSAVGLARIGDPDAVDTLLRTLNDASDSLHLDITPAVLALGDMGLNVARALLSPLASDDQPTRMHAQRALERIIARRNGFEPGRGFPSKQAEEQSRLAWKANGDYDYAADAASRSASIELWRSWLQSQGV
jgi:HEAT repeat protein